MKNLANQTRLPGIVAVLGMLGLLLRWLLYTFAVDEKNLLPVGHPLEIGLWVLTLAAAVLIFFAALRAKESASAQNASAAAFAGCALAALGIWTTMLLNEGVMPGILGLAWKGLGYLAAPALLLNGLCRLRGKPTFFLAHIGVCLFLAVHIVNHYQMWSGNPQLQDYVFSLFGTMALMFFAFFSAAQDAGSGKRRLYLAAGLLAVYLSIVALSGTEYPFLFLGGVIWVLTSLGVPQTGQQEGA